MKKQRYVYAILVVILVATGTLASLSSGEEQVIINDQSRAAKPQTMPAFPPSDKCTSSSPCRHVAGEITRIEESYWIKLPNGNEMRLKATKEAKMDKLPKVGDRIAAQIDSTGDVQAMAKLKEIPEPTQLPVPEKSMQDLR